MPTRLQHKEQCKSKSRKEEIKSTPSWTVNKGKKQREIIK